MCEKIKSNLISNSSLFSSLDFELMKESHYKGIIIIKC